MSSFETGRVKDGVWVDPDGTSSRKPLHSFRCWTGTEISVALNQPGGLLEGQDMFPFRPPSPRLKGSLRVFIENDLSFLLT